MQGSNRSFYDRPVGPRQLRMWQAIHSFIASITRNRKGLPSRIPVVAMVVTQQDRDILTSVSGPERLDWHFAGSCEEAWAVANQLAAPVILVDRDWPGTEWRTAVESLATLQHQASVILVSGVADDYLWQEVIRRGGYDILSKPLRADNVARVVKLAFSYWKSAPKRAVSASGRRQ